MCQSMTLADKTHFCNICVSSSLILPSLQTKRVLAESSPQLRNNIWIGEGNQGIGAGSRRRHPENIALNFTSIRKVDPTMSAALFAQSTGNVIITIISYSITNISFCSVCIIHSVNIPSTEDGHRGAGCTRHPKIQNTRGDTGKNKNAWCAWENLI